MGRLITKGETYPPTNAAVYPLIRERNYPFGKKCHLMFVNGQYVSVIGGGRRGAWRNARLAARKPKPEALVQPHRWKILDIASKTSTEELSAPIGAMSTCTIRDRVAGMRPNSS